MAIVKDFFGYLWLLLQDRWIATISLIVSFALTLAAAAGRSIGLPARGWALVGEAVLIVAGFLLWRGSRPMDERHAADLQTLLVPEA